MVNCPEDFTQTVVFGTTSASVNFVTPTATDNSGVVFLDSSSHLPGDFFLVGQTQVTYSFRDASNNFGETCQFFVNLVAGESTIASQHNMCMSNDKDLNCTVWVE